MSDGLELSVYVPNIAVELEEFMYVIPDANAPMGEIKM